MSRVVVITGGCGEIGGATVQKLAHRGDRVVVLDIWPEERGRARTAETGGQRYIRCDQSDAGQVDKILRDVAGEFGRLDVTIGNGAVAVNKPFLETSPEDFDLPLRVNLSRCFYLALSSGRIMKDQEPLKNGVRGKILFTSTFGAVRPLKNCCGYFASKAGLDCLVRAISQELAPWGIRANAVAPGVIPEGLGKPMFEASPQEVDLRKKMIPLGEFGTGSQIADAYAFLVSHESDYMTGSIITVDGGATHFDYA